jgi:predicted transcriptional regulator
MNFQKKVNKNNYVREYVRVLNGLLDLTPREMEVLTEMIKVDMAWVPRTASEVKNVLSTDSRRSVLKETNMGKSNFTKILNKLISIGLLVLSTDNKYIINDLLKPKIDSKGKVEVRFVLDVE